MDYSIQLSACKADAYGSLPRDEIYVYGKDSLVSYFGSLFLYNDTLLNEDWEVEPLEFEDFDSKHVVFEVFEVDSEVSLGLDTLALQNLLQDPVYFLQESNGYDYRALDTLVTKVLRSTSKPDVTFYRSPHVGFRCCAVKK